MCEPKEKGSTVWKMSEYGLFSGTCSLIYGLNTETDCVNFRSQSEYGKIQARKRSIFVHIHAVVMILFFEPSFSYLPLTWMLYATWCLCILDNDNISIFGECLERDKSCFHGSEEYSKLSLLPIHYFFIRN